MIINKKISSVMKLIVRLFFILCFLIGIHGVKAEANDADIVVENGMVMLDVVHGNEQAVTNLLPYLQQMPEFANMAMVLLQPKGAAAMVLLSGNDEEQVRTAAGKLQVLLSEVGRPHRIIISAYLRELDMADNQSTGIDWSSLTGNLTYGISGNRQVNGNSYQYFPNIGQWVKTAQGSVSDTITTGLVAPSSGYYGVNAQLTSSLSKSRVIMGSNLYTPNGMQGQILSQTIVPLQTTDSNGNASLTSQTISSDVKITPTIVKYNAERPNESIVRLDVYMQMGLITGTVQVGQSSAKEFSTKTLNTTGYVKSDHNVYVVGVFAGDTETQSVSGIPILMNIPILKYLFSQETKQMTHKVGVLTVSVRILPE
ncbi:MAG: type and secretion system protein [Firmicutes bacterium]|nr:type and secretion system protein [Bacillota bacterium]